MFGSWTTHHQGTFEGRPVTVQTYSEGGFRIKTTQGADDDGTVISDGTSVAILSPTSAGRPIDIEGDTIEEIRTQLMQEGFSEESITAIVDHLPT